MLSSCGSKNLVRDDSAYQSALMLDIKTSQSSRNRHQQLRALGAVLSGQATCRCTGLPRLERDQIALQHNAIRSLEREVLASVGLAGRSRRAQDDMRQDEILAIAAGALVLILLCCGGFAALFFNKKEAVKPEEPQQAAVSTFSCSLLHCWTLPCIPCANSGISKIEFQYACIG